jgi:hypothetical protein
MCEAREGPFRRHMQRDAGLKLLTETLGAETGSEYRRNESGEDMVVAVLAEPVQTRLRKGALQVRRAQHGCRDSAPRLQTGVRGGCRRVVQASMGVYLTCAPSASRSSSTVSTLAAATRCTHDEPSSPAIGRGANGTCTGTIPTAIAVEC